MEKAKTSNQNTGKTPNQSFYPDLVVIGFKYTGIWPYDLNIFADKDIIDTTPGNHNASLDIEVSGTEVFIQPGNPTWDFLVILKNMLLKVYAHGLV